MQGKTIDNKIIPNLLVILKHTLDEPALYMKKANPTVVMQ